MRSSRNFRKQLKAEVVKQQIPDKIPPPPPPDLQKPPPPFVPPPELNIQSESASDEHDLDAVEGRNAGRTAGHILARLL